MKIKLITVGKLKEKYLKDAIAEYVKRLSRFTKFEIIELPDEKIPDKASHSEKEKILEKEGQRILQKIGEREFVFVLAIEGQQFSSENFSQLLENASVEGYSDLTFVIGASLGLTDEVKNQADILMSFGKLTFPHQLMRLVLTEQIYRAFMIQQSSPYHK